MGKSVNDAIKDAQTASVRHSINAISAILNITRWRIQQIVSAVEKSRKAYFMMRKYRAAMKYVETGKTMGDINVMMGTQQIEMDVQGTVK